MIPIIDQYYLELDPLSIGMLREKLDHLVPIYDWLQDPKTADQEVTGKQSFLQSGKYEQSRLQAVGISNKVLKRSAARYYNQHQDQVLTILLPEIDLIMQADIYELQLWCLYLLEKFQSQFTQKLFDLINQNWIDLIDYWAIADHLSINVMMYFPLEETYYRQSLQQWLTAESYWRRRLGLTAYVKRVRSYPQLVASVLSAAEVLVVEDNYYIRKAISWVIREAYKNHPQSHRLVYQFLSEHITQLTKTMLRDAMKYLTEEQQQHLLDLYDRS